MRSAARLLDRLLFASTAAQCAVRGVEIKADQEAKAEAAKFFAADLQK